VVSALALALIIPAIPAGAQEGPDRTDRALPGQIEDLKLDRPITVSGANVLQPESWSATGPQRVIVHLSTPSLAEANTTNPNQQLRDIAQQQDAFIKRAERNGATVLARVSKVLNAVFIEVDASALDSIAGDSAVTRVARVADYELDLAETVPYIGAAAVQADGVDGSGVSVAVLDSGIDYYHAALGGSGDVAEYLADDPTVREPGTFPTAKVVGGYDFVGSDWTGADGGPPEAPDADPLDDGPGAGHGTHVGHIIAGVGGVAPGADLYAVKVCSSISTACSGIALIQGMDFAVDPNGDGKVKDHVDIVNMSLGSTYGQPFDDDLSMAVDNASALGVLTVASAGNSANKPYVTGTPSATPTALSVAQTAVPSAVLPLMEVTAPGAIAGLYPAVFQPWSAPLTSVIEAPLIYGDGAGGNLNGCAPFAGSLAGFIVLVDRGACNFTLKISNISQAGGEAGIIGLVAPGDPFSGGDGGDRPIDIPGYMISQSISNTLKAGLPATVVRFDPATGIPQIMSMVGSSSRGPSNFYQQIKPEIGAPGASVSAIAGSGTGEGPFGGTSGAAPMVAGSAALLLDGFGTNQKSSGGGFATGRALSPAETKALLMNNAETAIINDVLIGDLAPITRIGGGEVRVDRAMAAPAAAWDANAPQAGLSFGMHEVDGVTTLTRTVQVHNYSNERHTYSVTPTFRFADDLASGAVSVAAPSSVTINPGLGNDSFFDVTLTIDGSLLPGNFMNSGSMGADGAALTANEFDGYLVLDNGTGHVINIPWQVLPRRAAHVVPSQTSGIAGGAVIGLDNQGVGIAQNDAYALVATSPAMPEGPRGGQSPTPDIAAVGINTIPVPAFFCSGEESFIWVFAVSSHEEQSHLLPVSHQFWLDTDRDGTDDYVVLNRDVTFSSSSDGRQLTWVLNLATGSASAFFFAEHAMNTGNTALFVCGEQIGMNASNFFQNVDMDVVALDVYFGGPGDSVTDLTVAPLGEQYLGLPNDVPGKTNDPAGLTVLDFGPLPGNTPEEGLLLFTNGDRGGGARGGATDATQYLIFTP
jgi:subtilisin family serine protease